MALSISEQDCSIGSMQKLTHISRPGYLTFWLVHLALIFVMFRPLVLHPGNTMLRPSGDGLKNYFTLQAYIAQPEGTGMTDFTAMQYPYGESVWYTDNSPAIAFIMRAFSLHVSDISKYAVPIFNWLMLLQIILSPIVLLKILRRLLRHEYVIVCGALVIMWMSPQLLRMFTGTMNLSMMIWYFLVILQMLRLYDAWKSNSNKQVWIASAWICFIIVLASCIHLYYLLLLGMPVLLFVAIYALLKPRQLLVDWKYYLWPSLAVISAVLIVLLTINSTDAHLSMRTGTPDGVSIPAWQLRAYQFYKAKADIHVLPFLGGRLKYDYEQGPYMGLFFWLLASMLLIQYSVNSIKTRKWQIPVNRPVTASIIVLVLIYFTGAGMEIVAGKNHYLMENYFNPLYYVAKVYPPIEHFRCIGRMGWWIFYAAHFGLLMVVDRFAFAHFRKSSTIVVAVCLCLTGIDMIGIASFARKNTSTNIFSDAALAGLPDISYADYQAILPIPYYNVGSEEYAYTLDDVDQWSAYTYQVQLKSGLPLMSVKLSRTPKTFAHNYVQMLIDGQMPASLREKMNDKPVLVIYDASVTPMKAMEPAATANRLAPQLIEKQNMQLLLQIGTISYYAWYLP